MKYIILFFLLFISCSEQPCDEEFWDWLKELEENPRAKIIINKEYCIVTGETGHWYRRRDK